MSKKNKRSSHGGKQPSSNYPMSSMKEFYNNEGYWSDDEEMANAGHNAHPAGQRSSKGRNKSPAAANSNNNNNSTSLSNNSNSEKVVISQGHRSLPREPHSSHVLPYGTLPTSTVSQSNAGGGGGERVRKSSRGSYINESKFP